MPWVENLWYLGGWWVEDDRGRTVGLYSARTRGTRDLSRDELVEILRGSGRMPPSTRRTRFGRIALVLVILYGLGVETYRYVYVPTRWNPYGIACGIAILAAMRINAAFYFHISPRAYARAFVRSRRCAHCAYDLTNRPLEADGCVVCSECGAAWRFAERRQRPS